MSFPHCKGRGDEIQQRRVRLGQRTEDKSTQQEEMEDVASEVVFACHRNVGQSPVEDSWIARVVNGLYLSPLI